MEFEKVSEYTVTIDDGPPTACNHIYEEVTVLKCKLCNSWVLNFGDHIHVRTS